MSKFKKDMEEMREQYNVVEPPKELTERLEKLMSEQKKTSKNKMILRRFGGGVIAAAAALTIATNTSAQAADLLAGIPIIGAFTQVVTFRDYAEQNENIEANIKSPHVQGLGDEKLEAELNAKFDKFADELIAQYEADVKALGSEGHKSVSSSYQVINETERLLTIEIETLIEEASSVQLKTYYNVDKQAGKLLSLQDLFKPGADYIPAVSAEIKKQMMQQMKENEEKAYFIRSDEEPEGFDTIDAQQQFYINGEGKLVISFDEYDVAPGYMGAVSFVIPTDVISNILSDKAIIK